MKLLNKNQFAQVLQAIKANSNNPIAADSWHKVGDIDEPSLQPPWNYPNSSYGCYFKKENGLVTIKITVSPGGTPANLSIIFILPSGYIPNLWHTFAIQSYTCCGGINNYTDFLQIEGGTGNVKVTLDKNHTTHGVSSWNATVIFPIEVG